MKNGLYFFSLLLALAGCRTTTSEQGELKDLETRVLAVHDEAMAEMGKIYRLRKNLRQLSDSLRTRAADSSEVRSIDSQVVLLVKADEEMMEWMRHYKAPAKTQKPEASRLYLSQEMEKIEKIETQIDSAISGAEKLLSRYDHKK